VSRLRAIPDWVARYPLALFLPLQAALLFPHLGLLPAWGDEVFTLRAASLPLASIARAVAADIHPPLYYYLLHGWIALPLPGDLIVRMRALSVIWMLLSTVAVSRLWVLHRERRSTTLTFLALWTLSPCLLLYGRMARSYSMQICLASVALYAGLAFLRDPRRRVLQVACAGALAALLYTHYVPGAAVTLAVGLALVWRAVRKRDARLLGPLGVVAALTAVLYAPWLLQFDASIWKWTSRGSLYALTGNGAAEQFVKAGYWLFSFAYGETMPVVVVIAALALAPLVCRLIWLGGRNAPDWLPLVAAAALIGFLATTRWVSFAFIPARLLFCYPFFLLLVVRGRERSPRLGQATCAAMLVISLFSLPSYFRKQDFLSKGYAAPFGEMAALVNAGLSPGALVAIDAINADPRPLRALLDPRAQIVLLRGERSAERVRDSRAPVIWYIRCTHDASPRQLNRMLEADLERRYRVRRFLFQPYSSLERLAIRIADWPGQPTHVYEVLELRAADQARSW
jgi:hypothetical protein